MEKKFLFQGILLIVFSVNSFSQSYLNINWDDKTVDLETSDHDLQGIFSNHNNREMTEIKYKSLTSTNSGKQAIALEQQSPLMNHSFLSFFFWGRNTSSCICLKFKLSILNLDTSSVTLSIFPTSNRSSSES